MKAGNRSLALLALALCVIAGCPALRTSPKSESMPFPLDVVATTMTQIVV
jgi:hypothetical protein